jgi:hypothetical protein
MASQNINDTTTKKKMTSSDVLTVIKFFDSLLIIDVSKSDTSLSFLVAREFLHVTKFYNYF